MKVRVSGKRLDLRVFFFLFALIANSVFGQDTLVLKTDFEKGTQKWERRGTGSISIGTTKKQSATGKKSLRVSGRRENWQGAQLNLTRILAAGKDYRFTVSVKLAKGEANDQIKMTMQSGDNQFTDVAAVNANADEWSTFSGKYRPTGKAPYLLIYVEAARERTSYFLDDFRIEIAQAPEQKGTLVKSDFQDGTAQNWLVRGDGVQMFSAAVGSARSLKVGGRTEPWHGLALDLTPWLYKGRTYNISVSAKLDQGEPPVALSLSIIETSPDGKTSVIRIAPDIEVTNASWVRLAGDYEVTTEGSSLVAVVESKGAKTSYFIDDFELKIP